MRPGVGVCTNTPGSHSCGCATGYELALNMKTCNGEWIVFSFLANLYMSKVADILVLLARIV